MSYKKNKCIHFAVKNLLCYGIGVSPFSLCCSPLLAVMFDIISQDISTIKLLRNRQILSRWSNESKGAPDTGHARNHTNANDLGNK